MTRVASISLLALVLVGAACGDGGNRDVLTVLAASSLTDPMTQLAEAFEDAEDVTVRLSFAGSSALASQANEGAPADVIITADRANMQRVEDAGAVTVIARNRLAIVVEPGNPRGIADLDDLGRSDVVLVLCAPEVPCGRFGALALEKAGVAASPASLEENVKGVVSKVMLGEADAGIVYATDVLTTGDDAEGVDIDIADDPELEAEYAVTVLDGSERPAVAQAWVDLLVGPTGREVLRAHGFLAP